MIIRHMWELWYGKTLDTEHNKVTINASVSELKTLMQSLDHDKACTGPIAFMQDNNHTTFVVSYWKDTKQFHASNFDHIEPDAGKTARGMRFYYLEEMKRRKEYKEKRRAIFAAKGYKA